MNNVLLAVDGAWKVLLASLVLGAGLPVVFAAGVRSMAFGAGGEFRSPMALAVIGGLIFSTVLSLVFVPAMFLVMDDFGALCWRFGKKLLVSSPETEHLHDADHHGQPPAKDPPKTPPAMWPAAK